jgi:Protein of unknown function, DUF547
MTNNKKLLVSILIMLITISSKAESIDVFFAKSDAFFKTYVIGDKVDYVTLKSNSKPLDDVLLIASNIDLSNTNINIYKAFWINTYNLLVIKGIVNKYPMKSVQDVKGFFDNATYKVANQELNLKNIEKNMLKLAIKDPFLNFVLVCGSNGCPPLINKAYLPDSIDKQLMEQTMKSINNPNFIRVNTTTKVVEVSEIFDWYKEDFVSNEGRIMDFINKYRDAKIDESYKIVFYKYDWSLNNKK